jgi:hypothetical protein
VKSAAATRNSGEEILPSAHLAQITGSLNVRAVATVPRFGFACQRNLRLAGSVPLSVSRSMGEVGSFSRAMRPLNARKFCPLRAGNLGFAASNCAHGDAISNHQAWIVTRVGVDESGVLVTLRPRGFVSHFSR